MHENVKIVYNLSRNKVNRELKKSKILYYTKYFEDNKNDIKKTWNGITSIINTTCIIIYNITTKYQWKGYK